MEKLIEEVKQNSIPAMKNLVKKIFEEQNESVSISKVLSSLMVSAELIRESFKKNGINKLQKDINDCGAEIAASKNKIDKAQGVFLESSEEEREKQADQRSVLLKIFLPKPKPISLDETFESVSTVFQKLEKASELLEKSNLEAITYIGNLEKELHYVNIFKDELEKYLDNTEDLPDTFLRMREQELTSLMSQIISIEETIKASKSNIAGKRLLSNTTRSSSGIMKDNLLSALIEVEQQSMAYSSIDTLKEIKGISTKITETSLDNAVKLQASMNDLSLANSIDLTALGKKVETNLKLEAIQKEFNNEQKKHNAKNREKIQSILDKSKGQVEEAIEVVATVI